MIDMSSLEWQEEEVTVEDEKKEIHTNSGKIKRK